MDRIRAAIAGFRSRDAYLLHRHGLVYDDQICDFMIEFIVPIGAGLLAFIYGWMC